MDADGQLERGEVGADGTTVALPTTSITLQLDRFIEAQDAIRQAVCLRSDTAAVADPLECEGALFLRPYYNPALRQLTFFQGNDAELSPDTVYRLTVYRPTSDQPFGIRSFDGAPLSKTVSFQFKTAADVPAGVERERLPSGDLFCAPEECVSACMGDPTCVEACGPGAKIVLQGCTFATCHSTLNNSPEPMGLNLSSGAYIKETAIGRVANQSQTGEHADAPVSASARFGRAMPLIAPGNPGNSYLLYKILADPAVAADDPTLAPGETDRLRAGLAVGLPMPPKPYQGISQAGAARLSEWIAAGADVSCDL